MSASVNAKSVVLPLAPSGCETSSIEIWGSASSFWIVPAPVASAIVALAGLVSWSVSVSSGSVVVSPLTGDVDGLATPDPG